jgi:formylglycine-generating enzyme required for sulfatase activity
VDAKVESANETGPKARVFISYSRKDMAFADRLEAALKARGFEPLIDRAEIYAFEDWWKRVEALIGRADTVVFVLSPDAVKSDVALREVAYATSLNKRFAPIVCGRVEDSAVPEALRRLNFIFFDDPERFDASADRLSNALQTDIGWIRQHTEYGEAARRWSAAGRPGGLLLHSPTLEVAEHWIMSRPRGAPEPTQEVQAYVAASRQGARSAQWLRRVVQVSLFTLLVGIIVGLVGWINQEYIKAQWRWYTVTRPYMFSQVRPYVLSAAKERTLKPKDSFRECSSEQAEDYCPEMVVVPAGSFMMGSPTSENGHDDERPRHQVTIARAFSVAKFELTFNEWDTCVFYGGCPEGVSDSGLDRGPQPVITVTWDDAQRYAAWLSKMTGKPYRLLTEAEWEYAARGGTQTAYPWGDDITLNGTQMAHCDGCGKVSLNLPVPVGWYDPNQFGLYDMVGDVAEWVEDCHHKNYDGAPTDGSAWIEGGDCKFRVVRGGSWSETPLNVRAAIRNVFRSDYRRNFVGFRVGRTLGP